MRVTSSKEGLKSCPWKDMWSRRAIYGKMWSERVVHKKDVCPRKSCPWNDSWIRESCCGKTCGPEKGAQAERGVENAISSLQFFPPCHVGLVRQAFPLSKANEYFLPSETVKNSCSRKESYWGTTKATQICGTKSQRGIPDLNYRLRLHNGHRNLAPREH